MTRRPDRAEIEQLGRLRTELRQRVSSRLAVARNKAAPAAIANGWKLETKHKMQRVVKAFGKSARARSPRMIAVVIGVGLLSLVGMIVRGKSGGGDCKGGADTEVRQDMKGRA